VKLPIEGARGAFSGARALEIAGDPGASASLRPTKIVAIGVNYRLHAREMGKELPAEPLMFLKPTSSLIGPGQAIELPPGYARIDYEAELGVVIGARVRHVSPDRALDAVAGLTCINDVTVRDLQERDGQWTRAKGFDTFCPIGPRVVGGVDPSNLRIVSRVNGETRQDSRTSDLIFSVPEIIAFVSKVMTLEPGDIIATGTPSGVGPLTPGDRVEIEIEDVGVLANPVVEAASPS
jgi:2-keto-4-pentenoate hydratase/2-oxohepta-3-ene-1,7-dioic acid hydratase in catechol pathway